MVHHHPVPDRVPLVPGQRLQPLVVPPRPAVDQEVVAGVQAGLHRGEGGGAGGAPDGDGASGQVKEAVVIW